MLTDKRKWVIIRIETKSREFLSKMLITHELIKRGYGVIITNKLFEDLTLFPASIYLINSLYPDTHKKLVNAINMGHKVVLMDEEGLVYPSPQSLRDCYNIESLRLIDQMLCFGEEQKKDILDGYPEIRDKIIVTGNPRMNMLNEYYVPLLDQNIDEIKKKYGDFILISSNFAIANPEIEDTGKIDKLNYMKTILNSRGEKVGGDINNFYSYDVKNFKAMKKLIKKINRMFPSIHIVVRPHPSESVGGWMELAGNNVHIVRKGALLTWIRASRLVIENNCTSAIESLYLGTPCISYRPYVDAKLDQPLPNLLSLNAYSEEEVLKNVSSIVIDKNNFDHGTYLNRAKQYISYQDRDQSVLNIVDCIDRIDIEPVYYSAEVCKQRKYNFRRLPLFAKIAIKKMIHRLPINENFINKLPTRYKASVLNAKYSTVKKSKYDGIDYKAVKGQLSAISKFLNEDVKFSISEVSGNIIVIPL